MTINIDDDDLEILAMTVRKAWVGRQKAIHPERVFPEWEAITDYERETDRTIAREVVSMWESGKILADALAE